MNLQNNDLKNKLNFALANIEKNNLEKAAEIYKKILKKNDELYGISKYQRKSNRKYKKSN